MFYKILNNFKDTYKTWANLIKFKNLSTKINCIVFYVEDSSDWVHLNPIIEALRVCNQDTIRITSDSKDKYINQENDFYIGSGSARTYLFRTLVAKSIVMTITDLNSSYLKKSLHPVHYFYVFHSIVSTHRVYREHAFDAYDTILCVGEHHFNEIRKTEKIYNLPKKNLIKCGYGRLDDLINEINKKRILNNKKVIFPSVLIAPSWGKSSIVDKHLFRLIETLIVANFKVTLRLHPMTERHFPNLAKDLIKKFKNSGNYFFDSDISSFSSLIESDILISDWSGTAMEYAFSRERPVIFIDTPPKINNLNWKKINLPCLEEDIRKKIGRIISLESIENTPEIIHEILLNIDSWSNNIRKIRQQTVSNIGSSGKIGADIICKTLSLE